MQSIVVNQIPVPQQVYSVVATAANGCTGTKQIIIGPCVDPCPITLPPITVAPYTLLYDIHCGIVTISGTLPTAGWDHYVFSYGDDNWEPPSTNPVFSNTHVYSLPGTYSVCITFYNADETECYVHCQDVEIGLTGSIYSSLSFGISFSDIVKK